MLRGNYGIYSARQNMLSQVGSITANGVQQQTIFLNTPIISSGVPGPTWPGIVTPSTGSCSDGVRTNPFPCFSGVRVFSRDYANPRIYTTNVAFEQELARDISMYFDFTHAKGVHLTRFLDYARTGNFAPFLGETMVASAVGKSLYRGFTVGMRKRFSRGYGFELNARVQARTAQPKSPNCASRCFPRNTIRKNNEFFSFDWRLQRPFKLSERFSLIPIVEMFNTFNTNNNIDPTVGSALFNFDGFLRQGVGDPRIVQLAVKVVF